MKNYPTFSATKTKREFYTLSFTWGLPMTLVGLIVAAVMLAKGHKPSRFGWCIAFELPGIDYGISFGIVMICPKGETEADYKLKCHEHGHALQNIYFGVFFPLLVAIPSVIRYQIREWGWRNNHAPKTGYDDIWFEGSATQSGIAFMGDYDRYIVTEAARKLAEQAKKIFK